MTTVTLNKKSPSTSLNYSETKRTNHDRLFESAIKDYKEGRTIKARDLL